MEDLLPKEIPALGITIVKITISDAMGCIHRNESGQQGRKPYSRSCIWVQKIGEDIPRKFIAYDVCPLRASSKALRKALCALFGIPSDVLPHDFTVLEGPNNTHIISVSFSDGKSVWKSKHPCDTKRSFIESYLRAVMIGYIWWLKHRPNL